jgi:hypothetical protein
MTTPVPQPEHIRPSRAASVVNAVCAIAAPVGLSAAILLAPASVVAAEGSSVCRMLEQRLAAVAAAPRTNVRAQLDRAIRLSTAAGCGHSGYASPRDHHCRPHALRIEKLRQAGPSSSGPSHSEIRRERQRLKAAQRANRCFERPAPKTERIARVERVDEPILTTDGSIPVPQRRPASPSEIYQAHYVRHGETRIATIDMERIRELGRPRPIPAERMTVRVVGGTFLPEASEDMDFMAIATRSDYAGSGILGSMMAAIEGLVVSAAVAADQ